MKESRFIELVNLYIDRQITVDQTAELEAELQASAHRRRIYQQYCRMHRATKLVYESFRQNADANPATRESRGGAIARFESRRRNRNRWIYGLGGLAAAACVALVLTRTAPTTEEGAALPRMAAMPVPVPAAPAVAPKQPSAPVNLVSLRNPMVMEADYQAMLASLRREEQQRLLLSAQLLNERRAPQSLFDDDVFTAKPVMLEQNQRTYRTDRGAPNQPPVEFTAFQFQR